MTLAKRQNLSGERFSIGEDISVIYRGEDILGVYLGRDDDTGRDKIVVRMQEGLVECHFRDSDYGFERGYIWGLSTQIHPLKDSDVGKIEEMFEEAEKRVEKRKKAGKNKNG